MLRLRYEELVSQDYMIIRINMIFAVKLRKTNTLRTCYSLLVLSSRCKVSDAGVGFVGRICDLHSHSPKTTITSLI